MTLKNKNFKIEFQYENDKKQKINISPEDRRTFKKG
jgi:hypothetical protein